MLYETSITIPASRTHANPTIATVGIARGIINKIMVRPRPGHNALAHCVILYHEHQIAPSTESMELHGDTFPIDWEEYLEIDQPPYELKVLGWNDDDTYAHTFDIFIAVLPKSSTIGGIVSDAVKNVFSLLSPKRIFTGGG